MATPRYASASRPASPHSPGRRSIRLRATGISADHCLTLLGPSKTESLSGYRTGVAIGPPAVIDRMEQLLGIVSLRTAGYNQSVLRTWLTEPAGWLAERTARHQAIRDALVSIFTASDGMAHGFAARPTEGGSYLFPRLPALRPTHEQFITRLRDQEGIIVTPGTEFAPDSGHSIRLSFSQDRDRTTDAAHRIVALARNCR